MGAMKRIVGGRADAGLCVLCGRNGPTVPFMSGKAHPRCKAEVDVEMSEWERDQAEELLAQAEAQRDEMEARGEW